jgi:hypothetical protein
MCAFEATTSTTEAAPARDLDAFARRNPIAQLTAMPPNGAGESALGLGSLEVNFDVGRAPVPPTESGGRSDAVAQFPNVIVAPKPSNLADKSIFASWVREPTTHASLTTGSLGVVHQGGVGEPSRATSTKLEHVGDLQGSKGGHSQCQSVDETSSHVRGEDRTFTFDVPGECRPAPTANDTSDDPERNERVLESPFDVGSDVGAPHGGKNNEQNGENSTAAAVSEVRDLKPASKSNDSSQASETSSDDDSSSPSCEG